ncbi:hypothetical protein ESY86_07730 [Subsaximicrobium wynnwilliamsii]|uniref:Uncharacterized protein n=1 Tax=Subsaximicrobium wynnwilliamsii TaxID=291179 RepID=A0A5C6ZLW3_9FLAO|nr:hypothetical protein [Subsaximicrobium wynnwilliamsii]TXD83924.1 hypothetical protein ESY87_07895 [Subsaximicrobium wynnwilliamsii]TXD89664.1 hypothetical protein ESY86_07730 [Subsaximicrobium wynnwilliamsii]TXE01649.1 hypothetical protein ESY88_14795 [Subsaximicrobium wynnwilliamsii]
MKLITRTFYVTVFAIGLLGLCQTSHAQSSMSLQAQSAIKFDSVYFQEWFAGIKVGGTGFNIFFPNVDKDDRIELQDVYFRNLKGKLSKVKDKYVATLKNPSKHYTFKKADKPEGYPFDLKDSECVISYNENGQTKFMKVKVLDERAGTYYENGPPSIYQYDATTRMATVDETD